MARNYNMYICIILILILFSLLMYNNMCYSEKFSGSRIVLT